MVFAPSRLAFTLMSVVANCERSITVPSVNAITYAPEGFVTTSREVMLGGVLGVGVGAGAGEGAGAGAGEGLPLPKKVVPMSKPSDPAR